MERALKVLALVEQAVAVAEKAMAESKVRETRNAIAVRLAQLDQQVAGLRNKWKIPFLTDLPEETAVWDDPRR